MTTTPPTKMNSNTQGYLVAIASALILSTTAILIRILTSTYQMPPLILAVWRDIFTFLFLALALRVFKPKLLRFPANQFGYLLGFGLVLALFNAFWTTSVALIGAALATVLAYISGAFTALLGRWLLKEKLYIGKWIAILLSFSGVVMISGVLDQSSLALNLGGITVGVVSGLMYAVYSLMGRYASQRQLNPWTTLLYTFGFASVFLFFFNTVLGGTLPGTAQSPEDFLWLGSQWQGWAVLIILAAGPTLTGFGLYNVSLSLLPSSTANLILTLEPAFTALIAFIFLGEKLTAMQAIGGLVIMTGVVFLRMKKLQKATTTTETQSHQTTIQ